MSSTIAVGLVVFVANLWWTLSNIWSIDRAEYDGKSLVQGWLKCSIAAKEAGAARRGSQ